MPRLIKKVTTVGVGGALAHAITIAATPILTRLYSPEAFSGWALFMSIALLFTTIAALRYEVAVVLPSTHEEAANIVVICIGASVITALCAIVFIAFFGKLLIRKEFHADLQVWLWCLPLFIIAKGIYETGKTWYVRNEEFGWYSLSVLILPFLTAVGQIITALAGKIDAYGLILGTFTGQFTTTILLLTLISLKYYSLIWRGVNRKQCKSVLVKYKNYPLYVTPYTLVTTVRNRFIYFLLGVWGAKVELGFYNLSSRLMDGPKTLLSNAIRPVFFQMASSTELRSIEPMVHRILRMIILGAVPFWILFLFNANQLFALVFGELWRKAGMYAVILSFPALLLLLGNWLDRLFDVLGKQRIAFVLEVVFTITGIVLLSIGGILFKNVLLGIILQACTISTYCIIRLFIIFKLAGFNIRLLWDLGRLFCCLSCACAMVIWVLKSVLPIWLSIFIYSAIVLSIGLFHLTKGNILKELKEV